MTKSSHRHHSLLAELRGFVPRRRLPYEEALRLAERQANRFRTRLGIAGANLPDIAIAGLPRIAVRRFADLKVSGLRHWHNGRWIIALNPTEPPGRQRFRLAHEFKHVLDHTTAAWIAWDEPGLPAHIKTERLADYFAGCLLMPKRHVVRLARQQLSRDEMAIVFDVTPRAMHVRLEQLGLTPILPRCGRPGPRFDHFSYADTSRPEPDGVAT